MKKVMNTKAALTEAELENVVGGSTHEAQLAMVAGKAADALGEAYAWAAWGIYYVFPYLKD